MELEILATKEINNRSWYLCKENLPKHLECLKPDFYDFAIQRQIAPLITSNIIQSPSNI